MHNILKTLNASQIVLDLGCGGGSFGYSRYLCRIIGVDVWFPPSAKQTLYRDGQRVAYLQAKAGELPLVSHSIDAVLCHHSMEHFPHHLETLAEIKRVLKRSGLLWIAVPNGHSFDDWLYRSIDAAHTHVNRFSKEGLTRDVQWQTGMKLIQSNTLFTGFVYMKKRPRHEFGCLSYFGLMVNLLPRRLNELLIVGVNALARSIDKLWGTETSQYGWAFVFGYWDVKLDAMESYFNVCWKCGSGHSAEYLKAIGRLKALLFTRLFSCPDCQAKTFFFQPPRGLQ